VKDSFGHGSNSFTGTLGVSHQAGVESALGTPVPYGVVTKDQGEPMGEKSPLGVSAPEGFSTREGFSTGPDGLVSSDGFY
jgi:hypothetical protein